MNHLGPIKNNVKSNALFERGFNDYLKELKKRNIRIRFVPNKERGYIFKSGQFKKK